MCKKYNRIQAVLLSAFILFSALPVTAFAVEPSARETVLNEKHKEASGIEMPEVELDVEDAISETESTDYSDKNDVQTDSGIAAEESEQESVEEDEENLTEEDSAPGLAEDTAEDQAQESAGDAEEKLTEDTAAESSENIVEPAAADVEEEAEGELSAAGAGQGTESFSEDQETVTEEVEEIREETDVEHEDNDALFEEYAEQTFEQAAGDSEGEQQSGKKNRGDRLTGQNKVIYDALKAAALEIASGSRDSSQVEIPLTELGINPDHWYSAEELGLEYIYRNVDGTGEWNPETGNAISGLLTYDPGKIYKYLMADCPYEMYWNRGGVSYTTGLACSMTASGGADGWVGFAKPSDNAIVFSFCLEEKYRKEGGGIYDVDTSKTGAVTAAVAYAQSIVADADKAGKSDYERLVYYKDRICEEVVYNTEAANNSNNYPDGGPWALIYVFDGDPSTNVVCEGYSEAFQYLCELSVFINKEVCAYSPTGTMEGGTGAGPHKWNIVHMDDGLNYMADVTNSDEGSIGNDGRLFLKGIARNANGGYTLSWDAYQITVEEEDGTWTYSYPAGQISYTYDKETLEIFTDEELTLSAQDYVPSSAPAVPPVDDVAEIESVSMTLDGRICMNIHVALDQAYVSQDDFMTFTCAGRTVTQKVSEAETDMIGRAVFSLELAASQMTDQVTFFMTVGGKTGTSLPYSVRGYADDVLASNNSITDKEKAMARAMLNYGNYTQLYAGYNTENPAAAGLYAEGEDPVLYGTLPDLSAFGYLYDLNDEEDGIHIEDAVLLLGTDISIRFYYVPGKNKTADSYAISMAGKNVKAVSRGYDENRKMYYADIEHFAPTELGEMFTLSIRKAGEGQDSDPAASVNFSVLSYCRGILESDTSSVEMKNLARAICYYYEAAGDV